MEHTHERHKKANSQIFTLASGSESVCHVCGFLGQPTTKLIVNRRPVKPLNGHVHTNAEHSQPGTLLHPQEHSLLLWRPCQPHHYHQHLYKKVKQYPSIEENRSQSEAQLAPERYVTMICTSKMSLVNCSKQLDTYVTTTAGCDSNSGLPGVDLLYFLAGEARKPSLLEKQMRRFNKENKAYKQCRSHICVFGRRAFLIPANNSQRNVYRDNKP